uniref:Uncharacterized protein n=1 Tax=Caenorhabditis japonica TaxID=281687 RepID=A0A8R1EH79_CAEJA
MKYIKEFEKKMNLGSDNQLANGHVEQASIPKENEGSVQTYVQLLKPERFYMFLEILIYCIVGHFIGYLIAPILKNYFYNNLEWY